MTPVPPSPAARPLRAAFYAPMKAPDDPTPSGDRQIARLTIRALEKTGATVELASRLRIFDRDGDPGLQARLIGEAETETARVLARMRLDRPDVWFTYHCYYKSPDLIGPQVTRELDIPYLMSEPSISPRRREGPWAAFADASEEAIAQADRLFWTTGRDRPALAAAGHSGKMVHLPAFVDPGAAPVPRPAAEPLRLLTIAMMRPGDKTESYRRLAAALGHLDGDWHLGVIGDGPARAEVDALFAHCADRVSFLGAIEDRDVLRAACETADLFLWPGVGEGVGMVYLEAQAAGLPVVAEDHPAQRELVAAPLAPPDEPPAFAALIRRSAGDRMRLGEAARAHVLARHSLAAAAATIGAVVREVRA